MRWLAAFGLVFLLPFSEGNLEWLPPKLNVLEFSLSFWEESGWAEIFLNLSSANLTCLVPGLEYLIRREVTGRKGSLGPFEFKLNFYYKLSARLRRSS